MLLLLNVWVILPSVPCRQLSVEAITDGLRPDDPVAFNLLELRNRWLVTRVSDSINDLDLVILLSTGLPVVMEGPVVFRIGVAGSCSGLQSIGQTADVLKS